MMTRKEILPAGARPDTMTFREDDVSVLVGLDLSWEVATGSITGLIPQITALEARPGWTTQGYLQNQTQGSGTRATSRFIAIKDASERDAALKAGITNFWLLDCLGNQDNPDGSQGNSVARELFERRIFKIGERYKVPLLIHETSLDNAQNNHILAKSGS
ncbi:hypothetical protein HPB51_027231 [Rhipicephalus microplus]|uniref:Uncharacterized protein n=1 Tax=Rhipicephalus microplus TaxID=6941 RepID=A0A9J6D113_RHIMP|nr:hypothetical protein HPB51_027231 [Rhipicephalus microplus]